MPYFKDGSIIIQALPLRLEKRSVDAVVMTMAHAPAAWFSAFGPSKGESGLCPLFRCRQWRSLDPMPGGLLRPPTPRRDWNIVSVTELSEAAARQTELLGQGVESRRPDAVVELLAGEGD
jgi:hypothetical protein